MYDIGDTLPLYTILRHASCRARILKHRLPCTTRLRAGCRLPPHLPGCTPLPSPLLLARFSFFVGMTGSGDMCTSMCIHTPLQEGLLPLHLCTHCTARVLAQEHARSTRACPGTFLCPACSQETGRRNIVPVLPCPQPALPSCLLYSLLPSPFLLSLYTPFLVHVYTSHPLHFAVQLHAFSCLCLYAFYVSLLLVLFSTPPYTVYLPIHFVLYRFRMVGGRVEKQERIPIIAVSFLS